jgi:phosphoglucosamine mutase
MRTRRYFGTDGIRGHVGQFPITPEFVLKLGWAMGKVLGRQGKNQVVIGKDTRISGYLFESALQAGLSAAGMDILLLGPMPTPAVAYLTRTFRACAGIVVSASHNPYYDNGIKFFSAEGTKLADDLEQAIEEKIDEELQIVAANKLGKARRIADAAGRYIEFCKSTASNQLSLKGLTLVLDCAHGATYHVAPDVFAELGAKVITIGVQPDGLNINHECGATYLRPLRAAVLEHNADIGIALDGDGDRVMMVDNTGAVLDGDELLYIIASARHQAKQLQGPVIGTLMSNLGLELALKRQGIGFERAKVGDRYVLELLKEKQGIIGGESSGHILCLDKTSTGDGIVSALQVLSIYSQTGQSLAQLKTGMQKCPQILINVPLASKTDVINIQSVQDALKSAEQQLGQTGRVLLRPSGTEPLIRVMVEGENSTLVQRLAEDVAGAVQQASNEA